MGGINYLDPKLSNDPLTDEEEEFGIPNEESPIENKMLIKKSSLILFNNIGVKMDFIPKVLFSILYNILINYYIDYRKKLRIFEILPPLLLLLVHSSIYIFYNINKS